MALGLYARRSMARLVEREAAELFEVTRQGFRFYSELFDQPFPFDKYDQLFVPEFNAGAMENVGAVTFHDSFLFRDPPTEPERLTRAEVVLHELAHMWFGDLVTMRWWDDLWLNESFATYLSFLALDEATRFTAAWRRFNGVLKPLAYRDDQLVTTHPIASDVARHRRGGAGLRRHHLREGRIGAQAARGDHRSATVPGWRAHLLPASRLGQRHARGLPRCARGGGGPRRSTSGRDVWISTASLNTIETRWTAVDGRIAQMTHPPDGARRPPHPAAARDDHRARRPGPGR